MSNVSASGELYHETVRGQRRPRRPVRKFCAARISLLALAIPALALCLLPGAACDDAPAAGGKLGPASRGAGDGAGEGASMKTKPTVASLSPAATDVLVGMGAADHLVAVSNYDPQRPEIAGLPRVGDYRTQDWEKLAALRPDKMVIQLRRDRMPAGLAERAKDLGIELVNLEIDDLDDVLAAYGVLGEAVNEPDKAKAAESDLRRQLETVAQRVRGRPKVPTLIIVEAGGRSVAGRGTFLHDMLTAAGGENVAAGMDNAWPTVDREKILELSPRAVIHLLPGASPQELAQARRFWEAMPDLPAVKNKKVHLLTEPYVMLPGHQLGKVAEQFALVLHPFANVGPTAGTPGDLGALKLDAPTGASPDSR
jgi:iron complex transport system substrate-binding protein